MMEIVYTVGREKVPGYNDDQKTSLIIPAGRYLKIDYPHELGRLNDYILYVYSVFLPTLGLQFRISHDLEKYSQVSAKNGITCEYYIPVA
jgi:AraC family transcriptional activator of mar-sox-rob regulon